MNEWLIGERRGESSREDERLRRHLSQPVFVPRQQGSEGNPNDTVFPPSYFQVFWYAVLPPIILQQAYSLRKADFFRNLLSILVFGIVGTLLTFFLLTLASFYFSRLEWVLSAGCTDGLVDFRRGREGGREEGGEEGTCFEDFSLIKSFLLAAILSASDGVAALKHLQPHHQQQHQHEQHELQEQHEQQQQQQRVVGGREGGGVGVHESSSSSSTRLGALILGENVLNEVRA